MDIYQTVTDRILSQLQTGVLPWRKSWATGLPKSLTTHKEYRGINVLVLGAAQFTSRYWVTYREAQRLGGHVRQGQKASPVVFWKWRTPEELRLLQEKTGKENLAPCVPFTSAVFNLDQVEGVPRPADDLPASPNHRLTTADQVYEVMPDKPVIVHTRTGGPAYCPSSDRVTMPHLSQFESPDHFYAVLFHELVHASGAPQRLNRFAQVEGDRFEQYSFEELVAEFGAAFLCVFAGISNPLSQSLQAAYIDGWARAFRQDRRLILRAASAAQRAADFIRGKLVPQAPANPGGSVTATTGPVDADTASNPAQPMTPSR